jgi:hypothetical protein
VTWFRRLREEAHPPERGLAPDGTADEDTPAALRERVRQLNRYINAAAGKLPIEAVVAARLVTDTVNRIIDTSDERDLDIYAIVSIKGILTDYLPTALSRFLSLDGAPGPASGPPGRTPATALLEQIEVLQQTASRVLDSARKQDADALIAHGAFLQAKFSGSDLDL